MRGNAYVSGNVGIGTFNPATTLNVMGNFQLGTIGTNAPERTGIITGYDSPTLEFNCHNTWAVHRLIGTVNQGLHYKNLGNSSKNSTFTIGDYTLSSGSLRIYNGGSDIIALGMNGSYPIGYIGAYEQRSNFTGGIRFKTRSSTTTTADTLIDSQGRLGINTLSPTYQLHVNGDGFIASGLTVSGLITANSGNFTDSLQLNGTGVSISGHTHTTSNITDFTESVQDVIGTGFILAGSGIGVSYNDAGNSFTITSQTLPTTRQTYSITASSGTFTVTAGYTAGYLDVYHNGVKLIDGSDYTATNGTTFVLTNPAVSGDVVEALSSRASVVLQTLMAQAYINALNAVTNNVGGMLYLWANYR